jgi:hypothetical protein
MDRRRIDSIIRALTRDFSETNEAGCINGETKPATFNIVENSLDQVNERKQQVEKRKKVGLFSENADYKKQLKSGYSKSLLTDKTRQTRRSHLVKKRLLTAVTVLLVLLLLLICWLMLFTSKKVEF